MTSSFCEISGVVIMSMSGMLMSNIQVLSNMVQLAKPNFYIYKIVFELNNFVSISCDFFPKQNCAFLLWLYFGPL